MAVKLALQYVRDAIADQFEKDGTGVEILFGWRAVAQQVLGTRRLVVVPGDDSNGDVGDVGNPKQIGKAPTRDLGELREKCTMYIHAAESLTPEDEEAQYNEARLVFEALYRALHHAAYGRFRIVQARWLTSAKERRYGLGIRVVLELSAPLTDSPLGAADYYQLASPFGEEVVAEIDVSKLDQTTTLEVLS